MSKTLSVPNDFNLERRWLAALTQHPDIWYETEVSTFASEKDFYVAGNSDAHKIIFRVLKLLLEEKKPIDKIVLASKCKELNISTNGADLYELIDNFDLIPITKESAIEIFKQLKKVTFLRDTFLSLRTAAQDLIKNKEKNIEELIEIVDKNVNTQIDQIFSGAKEPVSLTENLYDFVEHLDENQNNIFIETPWPNFNTHFGGMRCKDSYCFAGRPGENKSTVLTHLGYEMANNISANFQDGKPLPVLYLDTEMEKEEQMIRLAAAVSGVDAFLIEKGKWKYNKELAEKVRSTLPKVKNHNFEHIYIPRLTVEEIVNMARRWILKKVGRGNKGIVVFDYLKLSGSDLKNSDTPRLQMAYKLDALKDFVKEETNCVLLFGAQRNRSGAGQMQQDDDTSIAESDHIQQLSNWVGLIKRKSSDELEDLPEENFGTHKLIPVKARKTGERPLTPVKINNKWTNNWINLKFDNFRMIDKGTGYDCRDYLELDVANSPKDNNKDRTTIL